MSKLTHLDSDGRARMVDVSDKPSTAREAVAAGRILMHPDTLALAISGQGKKGEVMAAGGPMIRHVKDGNVQRNTWQEHLCHLVNDEFLDLLHESAECFGPAGYREMMAALTEEFARRSGRASPILAPYLVHLVEALRAWGAVLAG